MISVSKVTFGLGGTGHIRPVSIGDPTNMKHPKWELTIKRRTGPIHLPRPVLRFEILPDCPHAIDLRVVQIEGRVAGAGKGVEPEAADGKVPAGMNTVEGLEDGVEAAEVGTARDDARDICRLGLVAPGKGQVARQAARVVIEAVVAVERREGERTQVHGVIRERARVDAAATGAGGDLEAEAEGGDVGEAVGGGFTVAAHGGWRAIKHGGLSWILP